MSAPAVAAGRFALAWVVGAALGLFYGFLRPLRPRLTQLCDLIFVIAAFLGWIYVGFGICQGDVNMACVLAMALGGWMWEATAGRLLRPVFRWFWKTILFPFQKISYFFIKLLKKLFAILKKWVTIGWNIRCQNRQPSGGGPIGKETRKNRISHQEDHHDHGAHGCGKRHHRSGNHADRAE